MNEAKAIEEQLNQTAIDTLKTRDESYEKGRVGLNKQECEVFDWFREYPESTDIEIAQRSGIEKTSVIGRRKSLVEKGELVYCGEKLNTDTNRYNNTYKVGTGERPPMVFSLTSTEMNNLKRLCYKANDFQKKQIMEILKND